ncbi:MAG: methyltransferase domain-containing protein [Magnetococcales bacterium]|nr:methyltransferase domain-containing protein [Magnetococcales bacterium]
MNAPRPMPSPACPLCNRADREVHTLAHARLRHVDFHDLGQGGAIAACPACGAWQNLAVDLIAAAERLYADALYFHSAQTHHRVTVTDFPEPVTRPLLQAELLQRHLPAPPRRILDVGCFDGLLLVELERRFPGLEAHGCDLNPRYREVFPRCDGFHLWLEPDALHRLDGPFDLITLSHSIMYFADLAELLARLRALLAPDGRLFVQTADLAVQPVGLVLGDQAWYFTRANLAATLQAAGFAPRLLHVPWFPREACVLARPEVGGESLPVDSLDDILARLTALATAIAATAPGEPLWVLGTTSPAAFAHGVLGDRCAGFVDEHPSLRGGNFRDLPVLHPQDLSPRTTVVLPYGASAAPLAQRLAARYPGRFLTA